MSVIDAKEIEAKLENSYPLAGRWHNAFHLEMPFGLINDPNGLAFMDGEYHIFFQWNPLGCVHKNKCWAYTKTKDFVHYQRAKLAMQPTDVHDKDGCYSGCGFVENDVLRILYTCNSKDAQGVRTPAQRFGTLLSDGTIRKDEIIVPQEAAGYTAHFRDPYVFYKNGTRYFVLGAQNNELYGRALVYREIGAAINTWELVGEIKTDYTEFGYMWECPNLLSFAEGDVLLFCPQGIAAEKYAYQNRYQAGYVAGALNVDTMQLEHGEFQEIDRGFDFYAAQVMEAEGRHIMLGWMGMPEEEGMCPAAAEGWCYSLTVPRELILRDGHIYQKPVKELQALRISGSERGIHQADVHEYSAVLDSACELDLEIVLGKAKAVELALVFGAEKLSFSYNSDTNVMEINRDGMKLGARGKRKFKLPAHDALKLHILLDKSAVEIFMQDGLETAAIAVFPEKAVQPELKICSDNELRELKGSIWTLGGYVLNV